MASRFWVGGTGTWDSSTTTNWAATSGGAGGQSVPGSADTVTFDGSSGGGTVTVNFGGLITIQSLDITLWTGTLDFATNNNSITLTAGGNAFNGSGAGSARTLNMGSGTWTLSSTSATWTVNGATNLTLTAGTSTLAFTGTGAKIILGGGKTYNAITAVASSNTGYFFISTSSAFTASSLSVAAPNLFIVGSAPTIATLSFTGGSSSSTIIMTASNQGSSRTVTLTNNFTPSWCSIESITFSGGTNVASNSFGANVSGITINGPSGGGGGAGAFFGA